LSKTYRYEAFDQDGNKVAGQIFASAPSDAETWLRERSWTPVSIEQIYHAKNRWSQQRSRIPEDTMNFFLMQFGSLLSSGCPLIMSLNALASQSSNPALRRFLTEAKNKIEAGKSFSEVLRQAPGVFPHLFVTMLEVGEVCGMMGESIQRYSEIYSRQAKTRKKLFNASLYPAMLLIATALVVGALLIWVFPVFIENATRSGQQLPGITQFVIAVSDLLRNYWLWLLAFFVITLFTYSALCKNKNFRTLRDRFILSLPWLGQISVSKNSAIIADLLSTLILGNVPVLTALTAVAQALDNQVYKDAILHAKKAVGSGSSITQALQANRDLFPESLILMADVGEKTGKTGEMLQKTGAIFDEELNMRVERALNLIQPALVILMSIVIFIIALAMYLPIFDMVKTVR